MMRLSICRLWCFAGFALVGFALPAGASEAEAEAALKQVSDAFKNANLAGVGNLTSGKIGEVLRKLSEPLAKAKAASDEFDLALKAKNIEIRNLLSASLNPIADFEYSWIEGEKIEEKTAEPGVYRARIKFGPSGRAQEEDVEIRREDGVWRISPPAELARQLRGYIPEKEGEESQQLKRQMDALHKLADIFDRVRDAVSKGAITKREQVYLRLIEEIKKEKLLEVLEGKPAQ